jgi:DNA-binding MurR/RpiR family transcriptional regulator
MSRFSPGERRVARLLLNDPAIATDTVSLLARRAGVSAPTVVRFARRCGFAGYTALRDALRAEVSANARQSAAGQTASFPPRAVRTSLGTCTGMDRAATLLTESTHETLASLPATELDAAVRLLGRPGHRVFLDGGRFTGIAARCLALRLMRLRDGVHMVPDHPVPLASLARDLRRTDVLVLFDHRPYEERTARIARQAKASGARIVLFTDPWFSPVTEIADVVLAAAVRSPVPRTSLVPTLALIETLVAVLADSGDHHPSG